MRGQRIVSKISKFGNFTINNKNADTKEANSSSSRAPLGQISLNAPPSLVTTISSSSSNDKVPTKTIVDDGEEQLTSFDKFSACDDDDKQQKKQKQQKKLDKIGGQSGDGDKVSIKMGQNGDGDKVSTTIVGPTITTTTTLARGSSEAFEIYADDEDEENVANAGENDDNGGDDAGGWDKLTDENEDAVPSSMSLLWLGKENIPPPFEKRDILLNFSSGTDNSSTGAATASSLNSSTSSTTTKTSATDGDEQRRSKRIATTTTTTTTDSGKSSGKSRTTTTNTTTTTSSSTSSSSKKLLVVDENAKTCGGGGGGMGVTGADGRTDADGGGGAEAAEDEYSSELSSDRYHCPSEYMTALTHHSLKLTTEQRNAIAAAAAAGGKMGFRHLKNPMYCAYDADIYRWHLHRERAQGRARNYMPLQSDITEAMRSVLVDWCVDVVTEFELCPATFFLTVSLTDRTLSRVDCPRDKLQLLGAAAVLTASKMHEIFPPTIKDIVHATDDCYTDAQVLRMEKIILKATDFSLGFPLADTFAEFFDYFAPTPLTDVQRHMMWYLLELSTLHYSSVYRHLPSRLAAAAFVIAAACHPTMMPTTTTTTTKTPLGETSAQQKQNVPVAKQKHKNGDENATELAPPTSTSLASSATAEEQQQKEKEGPFTKWEPMEQKTQILRKELTEPVKTLLKIHRQACASAPDTKLKAVRKKFSDARHDRVARMELPSAFASQIV
ncbi:hypothetical protein niasHS_013737 [Heterodera schachtii]|uniref:Uncharacterized protein n=1 Tax=Heterodera schachtii TaxID=97005 RepID=A0ABD2IWG1_HETSC